MSPLPSSIFMGRADGSIRDLFSLKTEDLLIDGIASRLARTNRYCNETRFPYSVATHSVLVSHLLASEHAFGGLMHDVTEAFGIGDLISPIKRWCPDYKDIEARLWWQIAPVFGLPLALWAEVHHADERAYQLEHLCLRGRLPKDEHTSFHAEWPNKHEAELCARYLTEEIPWRESRDLFLKRYVELSDRALWRTTEGK